MKRTTHPLFFLGKIAYYIGLLLLFNFFFGLIFFRFFFWLITGGILLVVLLGAMMIGKNMIFGTKKTQTDNFNDEYNENKKTSTSPSNVIDVEAEVFEDENKS